MAEGTTLAGDSLIAIVEVVVVAIVVVDVVVVVGITGASGITSSLIAEKLLCPAKLTAATLNLYFEPF